MHPEEEVVHSHIEAGRSGSSTISHRVSATCFLVVEAASVRRHAVLSKGVAILHRLIHDGKAHLKPTQRCLNTHTHVQHFHVPAQQHSHLYRPQHVIVSGAGGHSTDDEDTSKYSSRRVKSVASEHHQQHHPAAAAAAAGGAGGGGALHRQVGGATIAWEEEGGNQCPVDQGWSERGSTACARL